MYIDSKDTSLLRLFDCFPLSWYTFASRSVVSGVLNLLTLSL